MIIDNRERELISQNAILPTGFSVKQLPIGDIWLGTADVSGLSAGGCVIVERKTVRDFEASVLDGRYREQRIRLMAYCQEVGAVPMYVIEGAWTSGSGRISREALMKLAARVQCKHGVTVLQTAGVEETAVLMAALEEYIGLDRGNLARETGGALRAIDSIHVVKKTNAADPRHFAVACLAQCPGVSAKAGEAILDACGGTLQGVMDAGQEKIAAVVVGKKRVGPACAGRLWGVLKGEVAEPPAKAAAGGAGMTKTEAEPEVKTKAKAKAKPRVSKAKKALESE